MFDGVLLDLSQKGDRLLGALIGRINALMMPMH